LLVYFVTAADVQHTDWDDYLKNTLLKKYQVITGSIELGPRPRHGWFLCCYKYAKGSGSKRVL